jgi:glutamyl/glutaminyl-tRNA synthetase
MAHLINENIGSLKTRFAPTPSGFLHPGNAISFIVTHTLARHFGGKILLRIDDLDTDRMRIDCLEDIFSTLDWLGLDYDEGASGVEDFQKNYSQHTRLDLYFDALKKIDSLVPIDSGFRSHSILYACRCSRKDIREQSSDGLYPKTCLNKNISLKEQEVTWRIHVPDNTTVHFNEWQQGLQNVELSKTVGDFILRQKNGRPAYQLASVIDDDFFGVNFIVRGEDLLSSTASQIFVSQHITHSNFSKNVFLHHPLLTDTEGVKLSKSKGAGSLNDWREAGKSPVFLFQKAAEWLNLPYEDVNNLQDLLDLCKQVSPLMPSK